MSVKHQVLMRGQVPCLRSAEAVGDRKLKLTWDDHSVEVKDIYPLLANSRTLVSLRTDDNRFNAVTVSADGSRLAWPGALSITALSISRMPQSDMSSDELVAIMSELNLSSEGLAAYLGMSRRAVTDYRAGATIPTVVVLAVRYLRQMSFY